ncbi:hypothetical protein EYC08_08965 [Tabrizicola sp. WMC-M-20]|nr:hypothetical protein EYC08_08965 [Tabrizicola sp. WMC-M-20]
MFATHPLVRVKSIVSHEYLDQPPPEPILRLREEMGFDFGKFDYVVHDGQEILLDANKTPSLVRSAKRTRDAFGARCATFSEVVLPWPIR